MTVEFGLRESSNGGLSEMQGSGGVSYYYPKLVTTNTPEQEAEGGPNDVPKVPDAAQALSPPKRSLREFKRHRGSGFCVAQVSLRADLIV